ncbi:unnamed protein product [Ilex paraguariensis]|uniref:Uncharacterized protein n=1 Tax=Ilex paraguariensis TaxID=185542 RepID=A0ABC8T317_9AQUA
MNMESTNEQNETVTVKNLCRVKEDEKHHIENAEVKARYPHTVKYIEKKLIDKGVKRLERHPADGLPLKHDPKKGHGGKYTREGPTDEVEIEIETAPPAIDENDPNYVDEEVEEKLAKGEDDDEVGELVVGEVEVPKVVKEGVARIELDPHLKVN